jgi:hypothetical protein
MKRASATLTILAFAVAAITVHAQSDPREILRGVIAQAQTGTPNPNWYGAELWQTIAYQTNFTGFYPQLAQLGAVRDVTITQQLPLPIGAMYAMTARHAKGTSYWEIGISTLTNRIEYASFRAEAGTAPPPLPRLDDDDDEEVRRPRRTPEPTTSGKTASSTTEACRKFPNLCQ